MVMTFTLIVLVTTLILVVSVMETVVNAQDAQTQEHLMEIALVEIYH